MSHPQPRKSRSPKEDSQMVTGAALIFILAMFITLLILGGMIK